MRVFLVLLALAFAPQLFACVGCGQESYTPKMLMAGLFFAILPLGLVATVAWILFKDSKR